MKRTRFIMLALVAALVLMGAAYAAWSQTVTINSTIKTGELFVQIAKSSDVGANKIEVYAGKNSNNEDVYVIATRDNSALADVDPQSVITVGEVDTDSTGQYNAIQSISSNLSNVYPGVRITSTVTFLNVGSIKTKATVNGSFTQSALWDNLKITINDGEPITGSGQTKIDNLEKAIADVVNTLAVGAQTPTNLKIVQELPYHVTGAEGVQYENTWNVVIHFEQDTNAPIPQP